MTTALQTTRPQGAIIAPAAPLSFNEMLQMAQAFAASGFFRDSQDANKCIVKMQYGAELGIGPASSMMSVHIIEGKPAPSSNLMATLIKRSGRYNFRVLTANTTTCELECFEDGQSVGQVSFTIKDAERAGVSGGNTWKKYPEDMLFARAISRAARRYFADVFGGAPVYSAEELGADVAMGADGEIVVVNAAAVVDNQAPQRTERPATVAGVQSPASAPAPAPAPRVVAPVTRGTKVVVGSETESELVGQEIRRLRDSFSWTNAELLKVARAHVNPDLPKLQDATPAECQALLDVLKEKNLGALPEYASIVARPVGVA